MTPVVTIQNEAPFGKALYECLMLQDLSPEHLSHNKQLEQHYLAWETVRKQTNPYFLEGTGFEGYLVGDCPTAEAALNSLVRIGQNMLEAIARLYRFQYGFRSRLMKTLVRENSDRHSIHIWSAYLGAELGKLRCQVLRNPEAIAFQAKTYNLVSGLPPMIFYNQSDEVQQIYRLGSSSGGKSHKLKITMNQLNPGSQDAWLVATQIGQFGHPLVRSYLDQGR